MTNDFTETAVSLFKENKWQKILELEGCGNSNNPQGLLWVLPSTENLHFIDKHLLRNGCDSIASIGCGCGLFEWLLHSCTGVPVYGFEVNEQWWKSKYSGPCFIKLEFAEPFPQNCPIIRKNQALLFCYFNNHEAFLVYLRKYSGSLLFIIGPGNGRHTHTDPQPFKPNFENLEWILVDQQEVRNTKDFIAVYKRIK